MSNQHHRIKLVRSQEAQTILLLQAQEMRIRNVGVYTGSILYLDLAASDAYTDENSIRLTAWCGEWRILIGKECVYSWESVTRDLAETSIKSLCYGRSLVSLEATPNAEALVITFSGELSIRMESEHIETGTPMVDIHMPGGSGFTALKEHLPRLVCE
jgi:hypothetical protein